MCVGMCVGMWGLSVCWYVWLICVSVCVAYLCVGMYVCLLCQRYCKSSRNLKLVGRKYLNRLLNKVHVRVLLDRLLAEAREARALPAPPAPEEEEEEGAMPAWISEDPYGTEEEQLLQRATAVVDDDEQQQEQEEVGMGGFDPGAAEAAYNESISEHYHK